MARKPLVTRSSLRQHREGQPSNETDTPQVTNVTRIPNKARLTREQPLTQELAPESGEKKVKKNFYRKEKTVKPLKKSRSVENQKSRELNGFLMGAIVVVSLLIVVVMLATFFL